MGRKLTMEDRGCTKEMLIDMYVNQNLTMKEIGKKFNTKRDTVSKWLKDLEIEVKQNNSNLRTDFFKVIDTEEKAYWLGFVWCDGNVNVRQVGNYTEHCFSLDLCEQDHTHLYKLKESLKANNKIEKLKAVERSLTKNKWRYRIRVKNVSFCKVLLKQYNMVAYRTNVDKLKEYVPIHLMRHFVRGVVDADGSIIFATQKSASVSICVSLDMGKFIRSYFLDAGLIKRELQITPVHIGGLLDMYTLTVGGNIQAKRLIEHLYLDSTIHMDRKHEKAMKIINALDLKRKGA